MKKEKILGVLGGIGPLATVYFMDMLVKMTEADCDQDHISSIVFNHAVIPDRTAFIIDNTKPDPLPVMIRDAVLLEKAGADMIVIPCNTAHYFYDRIQEKVSVPIINIIEETVKYALKHGTGIKKLGILATEGTIKAGSYQRVCEKYGIKYAVPSVYDGQSLMNIIYNQVKAGTDVNFGEFMRIVDFMINDEGCDAVVLGCTELSVIHRDFKINSPDIIDSMEVLAKAGIRRCGKKCRQNKSIANEGETECAALLDF